MEFKCVHTHTHTTTTHTHTHARTHARMQNLNGWYKILKVYPHHHVPVHRRYQLFVSPFAVLKF